MVDISMHPLFSHGESVLAKARESAISKEDREVTKLRRALDQERERRIKAEQTAEDLLSRNGLLDATEIRNISSTYSPVVGIYFLIDGDQIAYVGQSTDMMARISQHRRDGKRFDRYAAIPCPSANLDRLERAYIRRLRPRDNHTHND